jgi:hypothetical protein
MLQQIREKSKKNQKERPKNANASSSAPRGRPAKYQTNSSFDGDEDEDEDEEEEESELFSHSHLCNTSASFDSNSENIPPPSLLASSAAADFGHGQSPDDNGVAASRSSSTNGPKAPKKRKALDATKVVPHMLNIPPVGTAPAVNGKKPSGRGRKAPYRSQEDDVNTTLESSMEEPARKVSLIPSD